MATYKIECEQCLGFSHSGPVYTEGESTVELSDEEVANLVKLIQEKNTTDVEQLDIETSHPDLFKKLDEAYSEMARHAEYMHWLWEGYENSYYEYDEEELMNYCERECGFSFLFRQIVGYICRYGSIRQCQLRGEFGTYASAFIATVFANIPSCEVMPNPTTICLR